MTAQITTIGDLLQACKNSPTEGILTSLINHDFEPITEDMDGEDGQVLLQLNDLEMAFLTHNHRLADHGNELIETHTRILDEFNQQRSELGKEKLSKLSNEIDRIKKFHEAFDSIFWSAIKGRLYNEGIFEFDALSIKSDRSIISHPVKEDDLLGGLGMMEMLLGGMMGGAAHEHDCDNCPAYDECPLSIKKPR